MWGAESAVASFSERSLRAQPEVPRLYSITSSARTGTGAGIVNPSSPLSAMSSNSRLVDAAGMSQRCPNRTSFSPIFNSRVECFSPADVQPHPKTTPQAPSREGPFWIGTVQ
jgi:hypothetical protein